MTPVTKTTGPIHFEDLEPHRFEDLIRQLLYDFRDWESIEGVGAVGQDKGYDIRAWEKNKQTADPLEEQDEIEESKIHEKGNQWMIQCKREKEIGPKKLKSYLDIIPNKDKPYGYILAAPVNFSITSQDLFRQELRKKGIMEFYLWGKAEIEDKLYQPKNDRILFTFFGISTVMDKAKKNTELKSTITVKNKLIRTLDIKDLDRNFEKTFLLRNISAEEYPYKEDYKDFKEKPQWEEISVTALHPLGLMIRSKKSYAYIDTLKKEFDFIRDINLVRTNSSFSRENYNHEIKKNAEYLWLNLPNNVRAYLFKDTFISFKNILLVDGSGDSFYNIPHVFSNYENGLPPLNTVAVWGLALDSGEQIDLHEYKKINFFPTEIPEIKRGKVYYDKKVNISPDIVRSAYDNQEILQEFYTITKEYDFINPKDVIKLAEKDRNQMEVWIQITHTYKIKKCDLIKKYPNKQYQLSTQCGEEIEDYTSIKVFEFITVSQYELSSKKDL